MKYSTIIVFLFLLLNANCQTKSEKVELLYNEGMELLKGNFKDEAKRVFAKAMKIQLQPEVVQEYVRILISEKRINDAYDIADECQYKFPKEPIYRMLKGNIHSLEGDYKEAIIELDKAISLNPTKDIEKYYLYRAIAQERSKNFEKAEEDYIKSLFLNPNQPDVYFYYGSLNYKQQKFQEATDNLNKAIQYGYTNRYVYIARGQAYLGLKETINACKDFRKACKDGDMDACKLVILHCTKK